ncbi:MAG: class I SAM-dependent methyltransferase [Candidatus Binatia bacterium]
MNPIKIKASPSGGNDPWETAYTRFETPAQEVRKFTRRLTELGIAAWSREAEILELCCGRGNGLQALRGLGFTRLTGIDLSAALVSQYEGTANLYVCDCRKLPFDDRSKDIVIVQGGLHHLKTLPDDLQQTLSEAARVLRDNGAFVVVEPWLTTFLTFVHTICRNGIARRVSPKIDALATMIEYERETYNQWLSQPTTIVGLFEQFFCPDLCSIKWGKYMYIGRKRNSR